MRESSYLPGEQLSYKKTGLSFKGQARHLKKNNIIYLFLRRHYGIALSALQ